MAYLEELMPAFRKGVKIRMNNWPKPFYYEMRNGKVYNQDGHKVNVFSHRAFFEDDWELYQEPIDWDYIIKNKCLCWFWDDDGDMPVICAGLIEVESGKFSGFRAGNGSCWRKCRPVRRDEVTFYESGEDEQK